MAKTLVKDIMSKDLVCVQENDPVAEFENHFKKRSIHHVIVENSDGNLVGIISSEDMARSKTWLVEDKLKAAHIMAMHPITIKESAPLHLARAHFLENRYRALPVVNESNNLTGIVTPFDILAYVKHI